MMTEKKMLDGVTDLSGNVFRSLYSIASFVCRVCAISEMGGAKEEGLQTQPNT